MQGNTVISVENVFKSFGGNVLFEGLNFKLNPRERVGIVGRNGHGKTTLFKLIAGEEETDKGSITIPKNYRIAYAKQQLVFTENSILGEGKKALPLNEQNHEWKVEKILVGLGFALKDLHRHPDEFSGGFQVRLNLAKALVSAPDLLLLDEPTNYLDITSIRWLENFLKTWPNELMLISHDRAFMDSVVTHIVGIYRKKARKIAGTTEKYYAWIVQDQEVYEKTRINDEKRRKEVQIFINRFRAKARLANLVKSRIKTLEKTESKQKIKKEKHLEFFFKVLPFKGKYMLQAENISFAYRPNDFIIKNFSFSIMAGERICIVGPNGRGKTTLLKILSGAISPDSGRITRHTEVKSGVFEQTNVENLNPNYTVEEEILASSPHIDRQTARNICGAMMFGGDDALKKTSVLSGGEKSRVMLGKLLASPVNLLLLDEPTNHLDMESNDALLMALNNFGGAIVMVTHNEMFLHALADRLVVFKDNGIDLFDGSYARFLDKVGWDNIVDSNPSPKRTVSGQDVGLKKNRRSLRREKSRLIFERSQAIKVIKQDIEKVEAKIESSESLLEKYNMEAIEASKQGNGDRIARLSKKIRNLQSDIGSLYNDLEALLNRLDNKESDFDRLIDACE